MTLRKKTLLATGLILIIMLLIIFLTTRYILVQSFTSLESRDTRKNVARVLDALENELQELATAAGDYASWNDTYDFVNGKNKTYIEENITETTLQKLRVNLCIITDLQGNILYGGIIDKKNGKIPLGSQIYPYLRALTHHPTLDHSVKGIIHYSQKPMLIASRPVITSEYKGPICGTLIMGRFLDSSEISLLSKLTHLKVRITPYDGKERASAEQPVALLRAIRVKALSPNQILGYTSLANILDKPLFQLEVVQPRHIYQQGLTSIIYVLIASLTLIILFGLLILFVLERTVLDRIAKLNTNVDQIRLTGGFTSRVNQTGSDEIANLSVSINQMLNSLEQSQDKLEKSKERYRQLTEELYSSQQELLDIIDFLPDPTFVLDKHSKVIAWNRAIEQLTGMKKEAIIGTHDYRLALYGNPNPVLIDEVIAESLNAGAACLAKDNVRSQELFFKKTSDHGVYLSILVSPIYNTRGVLVGAIQSARDITENKRAEQRFKFLSLHDQLTGLYNRTYFEQEIRRLQGTRLSPVGIIIADIDGLKIINDTLGHETGDELLKISARLIQKAFKKYGAVARIGGDEFAILLPFCHKGIVEKACRQIKREINKYNVLHQDLNLSISFGYCISQVEPVDIKLLYKEADHMVYREKMLCHQSMRSSIAQTMIKALEARDYITEGHVQRLQRLVTAMAESLDFSVQKINELNIFAQFHDFGKVGIPDNILFKPGPLTPAEFSQMQHHSEIGYRIARTIPELINIADWVLKHHEWWNGQGYPLHLKKEEIPLECRILAIADAYDAMTSDRPYHKAVSYEEALSELARCAGTQFDPELVEIFIKLVKKAGPKLTEVPIISYTLREQMS